MNFSVGEKALFVVATTLVGQQFVGEVVVIAEIGPWDDPTSQGREYGVEFGDGIAYVFGWQLRKLDPPPEPDAMHRIQGKSLVRVS